VALDEPASKDLFAEYPPDMIVSVSKSVADALAEKSGAVGIVSYYDDPAISPFAQFRMRRAGSFDGIDLRSALDALAIENGGGHPGAVGFRIEREKTPDIAAETAVVAEKVNAMMGIGPKLPEGGA
jgi:single-stranded DNA-specific DHH superfamily exonuclease